MQDINPQLIARLSQRLFFVVNKIDLTRTSEGLDPDEIKHYVANLVTSQLATEGFQLSPDQVTCWAINALRFLTSAMSQAGRAYAFLATMCFVLVKLRQSCLYRGLFRGVLLAEADHSGCAHRSSCCQPRMPCCRA